MKKFLFLAALAASMGIMTSCSQEDDYAPSSGVDDNAIAFSTKSNDVMTRSGQTINSLAKFTVTAVNADKTAHFSSVEFNFDSFSSTFKSATPYY